MPMLIMLIHNTHPLSNSFQIENFINITSPLGLILKYSFISPKPMKSTLNIFMIRKINRWISEVQNSTTRWKN